MPRKSNPDAEDNHAQQEDWIWGNNRGGGGAPLKDPHGNMTSNLKAMVPSEEDRRQGHRNVPRSPEWQKQENYAPCQNQNRRRAPAAAERQYDRNVERRRPSVEDDYDYSHPPHQGALLPPSPYKKFMSAVQDMHNSVSNQEKAAKAR
jgi:hypothetical protein